MGKISDSGIDDQQRASETREVTITLRLPPDIADQVGEIQKRDPEFLDRIVLQATIRRGIYKSMKERELVNGMEAIGYEEAGRIAANRRHDGGAGADKERGG